MSKAKMIASTILRSNLADAIREVDSETDYLLVTDRGKPNAALVNLDFFEELIAANSDEYLQSIKEARADYQAGRTYSHEQVFGDI